MADALTYVPFRDRVRDALARGLPIPKISGGADDPPEPKSDEDPKPDTDPKPEAEQLREMRAALKKANKEAADLRAKFKEQEDKDKSEGERATAAAAEAEKRADAAEAKVLRLEVATSKGLSAAQAKRLVGSTQEELEADADEILESFKPADTTAPPSRKPNADLKGGTDPTEEPTETDPAKLASSVPRL